MTDAGLARLAERIKGWSRELGFQQAGIADVDLSVDEKLFHRWLAEGRHGEMEYMERHGSRRSRPADAGAGNDARDLRAHGLSPRGERGTVAGARRPPPRLRLSLRPGPGLSPAHAEAPASPGRSNRRADAGALSATASSREQRTGVLEKAAGRATPDLAGIGKPYQPHPYRRRLVVLPGRDLYRPSVADGSGRRGPMRHVQAPASKSVPPERLRGPIDWTRAGASPT